MVVIEGNTRLYIYQEFVKQGVDGDWTHISTIIHEQMEDDEKNAIRLQAHLVGPRPWDPYSKAKYLHILSAEKHMTIDLIVECCGGKRRQVMNYIQAYNDMETYYRPELENDDDFDPTRFSAFDELQKGRVIASLMEGEYTKKDFAKWIIEGLLSPLETVRSLPNILQNPEAKKVFLKDGAKEARLVLNKITETSDASLKQCSLIELANEAMRRLAEMSHAKWKDMRDDSTNADRNTLEELKFQLGETLADMSSEDDNG